MKIPTKVRYGARLLIVLARRYEAGPVLMKDIARQEGLSKKYLEQIIIGLKKSGLVVGIRGTAGGYRLTRSPAQISMLDVFEALGGSLCLVRCVTNPRVCPRSEQCASRDLWSGLNTKIEGHLKSVRLADLLTVSAKGRR